MLIQADQSCLLVIDVQEKLAPAMDARDRVIANAGVLMRAAARLTVPVLMSEQYTKGLGATVGELAGLADPDAVMEKMDFSCAADEAIRDRIEGLGRPQIIICGIEAHVCVLQTALQLVEARHRVFLVTDATSSRKASDHEAAVRRMERAGVETVTAEMVLFEWLRRAGTPEFKELSKLIR